MNKQCRVFINYAKKEVESQGGTFRLADCKYVMADTKRVNGYFDSDPDNLTLAVAIKDKPLPYWLGFLSHEFAHFQQYMDQCVSWKRSDSMRGIPNVGKVFESFLDGEKFPFEKVSRCFNAYRNMELDCERRSLHNIKKFKLPIDHEQYCRKASAYIHFYNYMLISGKWYSVGREPYANPVILKAMPNNLDGRYDRPSKKLMELYAEQI